MEQSNISNSEKNNSKIKTIIVVIAINIIVIALAAGIGFGALKLFPPKNSAPEATKSSVYVAKVNKATGAEEYYDKEGNFVYQVKKEYKDMENKVVDKEVYSDKDNNTTKIVYFAENTTIITQVDEFKDGKVSVTHKYKDGKDTGECTKFQYTESGRISEQVEYAANGAVKKIVEKTYNKNGTDDTYIETDAKGNLISKTIYKYDKDGKQTKAEFYDADGMTGYVEYLYDKDGKAERMNEYKDGKLIDYYLFTYDKDGNQKQEFHEAKDDVKK